MLSLLVLVVVQMAASCQLLVTWSLLLRAGGGLRPCRP